MNLHDFIPNEEEQKILAEQAIKNESMSILRFTQECVECGKMTVRQAVHLRASVHIFIGATGTQTLDTVELPAWINSHCRNCDQTECAVYKKVNE